MVMIELIDSANRRGPHHQQQQQDQHHHNPGGYPYNQQQQHQRGSSYSSSDARVSTVVVGGPTSSSPSSSSTHANRGPGPKRYERKPPGSNHYSNWDAAKLYQNMSQYSSNPVGALQERYQSRGVAPEYRMVQAEGASHCPTFSFQVFIGDMVAMGSGSSKKQAKHQAAKAMLDKLDGRTPTQDGVQPLPPVTEITPPKPGEGNGTAKEKKDGDDSTNEDGDGDGNKVEGNGTAATSLSNTI